MRSWIASAALLGGVVVLASACATSEEWGEWRGHTTHFASDQHMGFSLRNDVGSAPRVTRSDIDAARQQNWWGKAITVQPGQIFQN